MYVNQCKTRCVYSHSIEATKKIYKSYILSTILVMKSYIQYIFLTISTHHLINKKESFNDIFRWNVYYDVNFLSNKENKPLNTHRHNWFQIEQTFRMDNILNDWLDYLCETMQNTMRNEFIVFKTNDPFFHRIFFFHSMNLSSYLPNFGLRKQIL